MKQKLLNKLWLRVGMIVAIMTTALTGTVKATDVVVTLDNIGAGLTSTANATATTTNITATGTSDVYALNYYQCKKQGSAMLMTKSVSPYISNHTAMPGNIKSVEVFINSGASGKTTYDCAFSTTECTSATSGIGAVNITGGNSHTFTNSSVQGKYFCITLGNANNGQVLKLVITCEESGGTPSPSISASNIDILYSATGGNISYSVENSVEGGAVSALVTSGNWLTLGNETTSPISFTCSANNTAAERTATVQLTYTYNTNETVTKDVTVTQAGNPNIVDEISDITASNTEYAVKGTIVAMSARGFVVGDGTGYVYYYYGSEFSTTYNIGDDVKLSGTTGSYGNVIQFPAATTVTSATDSNYDDTPAVLVLDATAIAAYSSGLHLSDYVQLEGTLIKSGNYYNLQVANLATDASISYPTTAQTNAMDDLLNKSVIVKGYFAGMSSGHFNVMLESVEEVVSTTPTITVSSASLSGFTYEEGNGSSAAQTFTVSGENLTANISLSLGGSDYEMSLTENGTYTSSLTLNQSSGEVSSTTVYVRLKAGLTANSYNDNITISSTGATSQTVSLSGSVTAPEAPNVTWNLSINETATATTSEMTWTSTYATMAVAKGSASTNTNNYYPGTSGQNYTSTRFYKNSVLTITPASGYAITSVVFTATTAGYASALATSTWTNATATASGSAVTVTPTDGSTAISAAIGGTCGFTEVKVYYETYVAPATAPVWSTLPTPIIFTGAEYELDLTAYVTGNPDPSITLSTSVSNSLYEYENGVLIFQPTAAGTYTFSFTATNAEGSANATLTVTAESPEGTPYTLATTITSGKHYVIAATTDAGTHAMAGKHVDKSYYDAVDATLSGNTLYVTISSGAREFIIYGPDADGNYSIYDPVEEGYLCASSSSSNDMSVQTTNDANGKWKIDFENETVIAQGTYTRNEMRYNSGSPRFSCYASGQTAVKFYEKAGEATPTESVTVSSAGYATFASDNALDFTGSSIKAFYATESAGTLSFTQVTKVPAGTGVLLYKDGGATESVPALTGAADAVTGNVFKRGADAAVTYEDDNQNYILFNGADGIGFYKANNNNVAKNRAYIHVTSSNPVKSFAIDLEDDATGIEETLSNSPLKGENIYNLAGQMVNGKSVNGKLPKGIYIVNGKKVMVK